MRFFIVLITLTLISLSVSANSIDQKKDELKKVYESGGITKTEYKKAIQFLATDDSCYMTGQSLIIDGGRTIW